MKPFITVKRYTTAHATFGPGDLKIKNIAIREDFQQVIKAMKNGLANASDYITQ